MLIERAEFANLLARLKPALRGSGSIPSLTHLWFDGKSVTAYDGGFGIRLALETELQCGVPGTPFMGLLATSVLKETTLEQGKSYLNVQFGKHTSKLATLDLDQNIWPFPAKLPKKAPTFELGEDFIEGLRKVLVVKASTPTRVEHHGIMAECEDGKLYLYTTDTMTMASVAVESDADFKKILLPRLFAEQIVSQAPAGIDLVVLDDCLIAVGDDVTFYSNVLDISAADDLGKVVADQQASHPRPVDIPAGLEGALSRAEILAGKEEAVVTLSVEKGNLVVTGDYSLGKLKETLELEGTHAAARLDIKAQHLHRALTSTEKLSLTSDSMVLRGEPDFLYIVSGL